MAKTLKFFILMSVFSMLLSVAPAFAVLKAVGPTNPNTGFPNWYRDTRNQDVVICSTPGACAVDPTGAEVTYFSASARSGRKPEPNAVVTLGLFGGYLTASGLPQPGRETTFASIVIKAENLPVVGVYTVSHPWGVRRFNVKQTAKGIGISNAQQFGGGAAGNFRAVLTAPIGPFFAQTKRPAGFLGLADVPRTITGAPQGRNVLTITGPTGVVIRQPLWGVEGQLRKRR
jgi:hypothetical protein